MNTFTYSYPVKVYFGEGAAAANLPAELAKAGKTVMLAYGGGSIKRNGHQSAFAIVEAKRSITRQQELNEALSQARSYAKLLGAKYAAIISQEKVWIYSAEDDYGAVQLCVPANMTEDELFSLQKILGAK